MANRVLILRWAGSAYDSLGGLLELTAQELMAQGFDVTLFAADGPDWPQQLLPVLRQGGFSFRADHVRDRRRPVAWTAS